MSDARWREEALRLFRRYRHEIVEAYGLCPWARDARMAEHVLLQEDDAVGPSLETLAKLAKLDIEVAVLVYPRVGLELAAFERFVSRLRDADAKIHPLGTIPFAMAAFHPDAAYDASDPERLIPFLRRTPDPTIQVVRSSVLDRVRGGAPQGTSFVSVASLNLDVVVQPPLRERIARTNAARVKATREAFERVLEDIRLDRQRTYAAL